jgi:hypothetical protein
MSPQAPNYIESTVSTAVLLIAVKGADERQFGLQNRCSQRRIKKSEVISSRVRAMIHQCDAVYRGGVFVPQEPCGLAEEAQVHLIVHEADVQPPQASEPQERARIMQGIIERWRNSPVAPEAFPLTREALHERR